MCRTHADTPFVQRVEVVGPDHVVPFSFSLSVLCQVNGQECGPVPLLVAFHKPKGVITTVSDDWDREDLSDVLPKSLLLK